MTQSRLWLLALAPVLAVALLAAQHLAWASDATAPRLQSFDSCEALHERYLELVLAETPDAYYDYYDEEESEAEAEAAVDGDFPQSGGAAAGAAEEAVAVEAEDAAPADEGTVSETGTNVQERGVDESDIIKTDGDYFYILRPQSLLIAAISADGPPAAVGRIEFTDYSSRQELLITADQAIVVRQLDSVLETLSVDGDRLTQPRWPLEYHRPLAEVLEIDLTDRSAPTLRRELDLHGRFLSARLVGGDLRIAFQHSSVVPWRDVWAFDGRNAADDADAYNAALQDEFTLSHWFPLFGFTDHQTNEFDAGYAIDCERTYAPEDRLPSRYWGHFPSTAFLLSFDLSQGIAEWGSAAVLGMADRPTVYASTDSLYLAAPHNRWHDTAVHRFDITDPLDLRYAGGAIVEGQLLSQWSLSEHNGHLRVATTDWDRWPTVSSVTILQLPDDESDESGESDDAENTPDDDGDADRQLVQVGKVTDLGRTESIFAVRFAGDVGYVVTFRQVDPLYVLDLSDPTDPKQVGELKIPGFSRYLHPLSGGLLFGVGRDADPRTGRERGLQATLFDVSDPANPTQLAVLPLGDDAFSPVEYDHRAFRYQNGVAWIPVGPNDYRLRQDHDGAFFGVRVDSDGLSLETTLRVHGEARRAIPLGEQIHLLSNEELRTYSTDAKDLGALSFALEWDNRWLPVSPE